MGLWLRLFLSLLGVVGLVAATLKGADWPNEDFWEDNPLFIAAIVCVALGSITNLWETVRQHLLDRGKELHGKLQVALVPLYRQLVKEFGAAHYKDFVLTAFLIRWRFRRSCPFLRRELIGVCRVGLKIRPSSNIRWTKGKGLVGVCWEIGNQDVKVDFENQWKTHPLGNLLLLDESDWQEVPAGIRYGLSFNERKWVLQHTPARLASPIQINGKFVGCVVVDCPSGLLEPLFNNKGAREQIYDAVQVILGFVR